MLFLLFTTLDPSVFNRRMAGFSLYVSNTTSKGDGLLCFDDIQSSLHPPSEDQNITCSVLGRYVIYYNARSSNVTYPQSDFSEFAYNELCELEVYGKDHVVLFVLFKGFFFWGGGGSMAIVHYSEIDLCRIIL